jgi:hypothetical protein
MLSTFKETLASIQDKTYGRVIITKSFKSVLWYWTKYVLIFTSLPLILFIAAVTYLVPQLSRVLDDHLPAFDIRITSGKFQSSLTEPFVIGNQNFTFIIDSTGSSNRLNSAFSGLMVLEDRLVFKDGSDQKDIFLFSDLDDFYLSKTELVTWISSHQQLLWFVAVAGILVAGILAFCFYWTSNLSSFFLWATLFWVVLKPFKKNLAYLLILRLTIYAAVPSLLLSLILLLAPNDYLSYLNLGVFVFFVFSWIWNLTPTLPTPLLPNPSPLPKKRHNRTILKK